MNLSTESDFLRIDLKWWEKILSIHGSFKIPLSHIISANTNHPPFTWKEIRCPGSYLPGVIKAGTYYSGRGKEFWCTTKGKNILQIELDCERFSRLVLEIADNTSWKDSILHKS